MGSEGSKVNGIVQKEKIRTLASKQSTLLAVGIEKKRRRPQYRLKKIMINLVTTVTKCFQIICQ